MCCNNLRTWGWREKGGGGMFGCGLPPQPQPCIKRALVAPPADRGCRLDAGWWLAVSARLVVLVGWPAYGLPIAPAFMHWLQVPSPPHHLGISRPIIIRLTETAPSALYDMQQPHKPWAPPSSAHLPASRYGEPAITGCNHRMQSQDAVTLDGAQQ